MGGENELTPQEKEQGWQLLFNGSDQKGWKCSNGKYLSITATFTATSKEQLDALYRELSSHPMVKIVL